MYTTANFLLEDNITFLEKYLEGYAKWVYEYTFTDDTEKNTEIELEEMSPQPLKCKKAYGFINQSKVACR